MTSKLQLTSDASLANQSSSPGFSEKCSPLWTNASRLLHNDGLCFACHIFEELLWANLPGLPGTPHLIFKLGLHSWDRYRLLVVDNFSLKHLFLLSSQSAFLTCCLCKVAELIPLVRLDVATLPLLTSKHFPGSASVLEFHLPLAADCETLRLTSGCEDELFALLSADIRHKTLPLGCWAQLYCLRFRM